MSNYAFLTDVKDEHGRATTDPAYDPTTLYIPNTTFVQMTAFEQSYWTIKRKHYDLIVFFRKGMFYELFEDDAIIGQRELGLRVALRGRMRLAGIPLSRFQEWAKKLLAKGYRLGRVDECESRLDKAGSVMERKLVQILTPATLVDAALLSTQYENHLLALVEHVRQPLVDPEGTPELAFALSYIDCSIGKLHVVDVVDDDQRTQLNGALLRAYPREVLVSSVSTDTVQFVRNVLTGVDIVTVTETPGMDEDLPPDTSPLMHRATRMIKDYLARCMMDPQVMQMAEVHVHGRTKVTTRMDLDAQTLRNLELVYNLVDGTRAGTLLETVDSTKTAFGKRMLQNWLATPPCDRTLILERQAMVRGFFDNPELATQLRQALHKLPDVERLLSRVKTKTVSANDLQSLMRGLNAMRAIWELRDASFPLADVLTDLRQRFDHDTMTPMPGSSADFDACVADVTRVQAQLDAIRDAARQSMNCATIVLELKKRLNVLVVPRKTLAKMPPPLDCTVESETKAVVRFSTPTLTALTAELDLAENRRTIARDAALLEHLSVLVGHAAAIGACVDFCARTDCALSLAASAGQYGAWCWPTFVDGPTTRLEIRGSVHPTLWMRLKSDCIPNDLVLSDTVLLTGPNMGGKSTLMRQALLLVALAQMGGPVPAESYTGTIVDCLFTRIGAQDSILSGQSTFMCEMREMATILHRATPSSLIAVDELGRGTSTRDGLAIATATLEHLRSNGIVGFFASHYRQLGAVSGEAWRMDHANGMCLYKVVPGVSTSSEALSCARSAGIDESILSRALEISTKVEFADLAQ